MKINKQFIKGSGMAWSVSGVILKNIALIVILWTGILGSAQAQDIQYTKPSWWFGVAAGANLNFYRGSTQQLNAGFTAPVAFDNAEGAGLYLAPLVEYHVPEAGLGFMFQAGYDSRSSSYIQEITPCNCPADLTTNLSYLTIEPSLRVAPFHGNFYLYGGPRFAFNMQKDFTYKLGINPAIPDQEPTPDVTGELDNINKSLISMQIGAGYDFQLSTQDQRTQYVFSPFVSYHPYFGQNPRSVETWNVTTVRVGAAFKLGHGKIIPKEAVVEIRDTDPQVRFTVNSPKNVPTGSAIMEVFPLRNYVFFDLGSTAIPDRYVTLNKNQLKDFNEDQLELFKPKALSGRSDRQMLVYYNVLNILGYRMNKNPSASINLVGSSEKGPEDGREMATSVKRYLVDVFGVNESRITVQGQDKPKIPSEQSGGTLELDLLRQGDRRVSIETTSPDLLMEFQNGPSASLKAVEIGNSKVAPMESYVSFNTEGATKEFASWNLEVRDEKGALQNFGPYTQEKISIPGNSILGNRAEGDYKVTMVGRTRTGQVVRREAPAHIVLWKPSMTNEGTRYSVLYEFNESKTIPMYEKYLTDLVAPKIPAGGKVVLRGYTDIIGDETNNKQLSLARANDVRDILQAALAKAGRTDVKFEVTGFGEDEKSSPFDNKYPEERFYNRTVIIDIMPGK